MILSISNLSISFFNKNGEVKAVDDISFSLKEKEITAIVGQSGSGKSVTALSIINLLPKSAHTSGNINFQGQQTLELTEKELCKIRGSEVGMIFQDPLTSLNPLHTIKKQIAEAVSIHNNCSSKKINDRIKELLNLVDLKDFDNRLSSYPHELSGGQKQRVMIAIALANNPQLLIADEPTTALDVDTQDEILKLLLDLRKKLGLTILFITHNLKIVQKLADNILVMHKGKIVETGSVAQIFNKPKDNYTKLLTKSLATKYYDAKIASSSKILEVTKLNTRFPIKKGFFGFASEYLYANKDVSFDLKTGETLGIIGQSGSGKSTLALAISSLIKSSGEIIFCNDNIKNYSKEQRNKSRKKIQIIFQDPYNSLNPRMTIKRIIEEGLVIHQVGEDKLTKDKLVDTILKEVGLDPKIKNLYPHQFSGGQRQRIAIARALILKPKLLILDEPTSALDIITQNEILDLLKNLQKTHQISYIFISHDLDVIKSISHKVMVIKDGEVVEQGTAKEVIGSLD